MFSFSHLSLYLFFMSFVFFFFGLSFFMNSLEYLIEWELFSLNSLSIMYPIFLDNKCFIFLGTVFLISSMVILYSSSYMEEEENKLRFFILVFLFVISMFFLIVSPCLVSILLGWDGLGVTSYCLVIFYQNQKSSNSGMITALTNRLGDVLILLGVGLMSNIGSWSFMFIYFNQNWWMKDLFVSLICFAAMTKSAQVPFSSWLPAAMAAPTPVSSLVHSSTLVTAGIYLLIRFFNLFSNNYSLCFILSLLGSCTMFMSGLSASIQFDMKKIIALSTLSQLGIMFTSLSLGMPDLCFFHLLTHAMFKSLLFMCAGSFIHSNSCNQDIRLFGNPKKSFCLTLVYFNTSNLALCGMPFLTGFYSKDLILELVCFNSYNWLIFFLFFFSTGLTVCYSIRLAYISINSNFNYISNVIKLKDNSFEMLTSMSVMFMFSIFFGKLGSELFLNLPINYIVLPLYLKMLVILVCGIGAFLGFKISTFFYMNKFNVYFEWLNEMWFLSFISPNFFKSNVLMSSNFLSKISSSGWIEEFFGKNPLILISDYFLSVNFSMMKIKFGFSMMFLSILVMFYIF
uniref:NADH dehydrogenase subunit 5 n=1 Tax=Aeolothrips xinjiangensis TaxID=2942826 RepID=UPI00202933A9|nr:NADH dehydrogenase subunit 5 [Aeolothrips xinjiangensis]UQJ77473.1 NADH dehydrogenase subunit 5 [Aeolothrips xinjiangensis]